MAVFPASVTPFDANGRIDMPGVARLLAFFRSAGCAGVVFAGTNGEGPSLSAVEKRDLVRAAVPLAEGLEIILGVATSSLDEAVWLCQQAHKAGASAGLVMPPAYFREATEEGLYQWFCRLADSSELPLFVYNFPQRTQVAISYDLAERLSRHQRIVGLKDSSGERGNLIPYRQSMPGKTLYVGDESLLPTSLESGWNGAISGAANVLPEWIVGIANDPDEESRRAKFQYLLPGIQALREGGQPALNKALLKERGILESAAMRLPLFESSHERIEATKLRLSDYVKW